MLTLIGTPHGAIVYFIVCFFFRGAWLSRLAEVKYKSSLNERRGVYESKSPQLKPALLLPFFQRLFHLDKATIFGQAAFHFCTSFFLPLSFQMTKGALLSTYR